MFVKVKIEGVSPLLCNRFNEAAQEAVMKKHRKVSAKSDATPREDAAAKVYSQNGVDGFPGENLLSAIIAAGKFHKVGLSKLTTMDSSIVPAYVMIEEGFVPFVPETTPWEVDSRPIVNPSTKRRQICHRPRFDRWSLLFTVNLDEEGISVPLLRDLIDDAGTKLGLGDYRPQRKGPFGRFKVTQWTVED